ncbi:MAG: replication protein P [Pseudomonadales bacterium]
MSLKHSNQILDRVAPKTAASPTTSATEAGPTDDVSAAPSEAQIDAINQVFTLFRLNFHNQYFAAFSDTESLNQIKKLWLDSLKSFDAEQILRGAKRAIEESEYLPTLHRMLGYCDASAAKLGLPDPHSAYREACMAPSPKIEHTWSHPAVYLAGRDSDWFFLANTNERQALPVFEKHYDHWCKRVVAGETLSIDRPIPITQQAESEMSNAERERAITELRKEHGL